MRFNLSLRAFEGRVRNLDHDCLSPDPELLALRVHMAAFPGYLYPGTRWLRWVGKASSSWSQAGLEKYKALKLAIQCGFRTMRTQVQCHSQKSRLWRASIESLERRFLRDSEQG